MKKSLLQAFAALFIFSLMLSSCSTNQDVVSNHWIQKRKYNKGFYIDGNKKSDIKITKAEDTYTAEEIKKSETPAANETQTAAVEMTQKNEEVAVNENKSENAAGVEKPKQEKRNAAFRKADELKSKKNELRNDIATVKAGHEGGVSMSAEESASMDKELKMAILFAIGAVVFYIIGAIFVAIQVTKDADAILTGGTVSSGLGIGGVFLIISYILWVAAVVYFILWLINKYK